MDFICSFFFLNLRFYILTLCSDKQESPLIPQGSITLFLHIPRKVRPHSQFLQWLPLVPPALKGVNVSYFIIYLFIFTLGYVYWFQREREEEKRKREREREKHLLVISLRCLDQRLNPQPRYVPWLGIEPATFWCTGWHPNQLSHQARAISYFKSLSVTDRKPFFLICIYGFLFLTWFRIEHYFLAIATFHGNFWSIPIMWVNKIEAWLKWGLECKS